MNRQISKKSWFGRNWKWLISLTGIMALVVIVLSSPVGNEMKGITAVYTDSSIYENALSEANNNEEVIQKLGVLEPIGLLAIIEGAIKYSNNNNIIDASFRVKGTKGKGRIAISADRIDTAWVYKKIDIDIKRPKTTIKVLE